MMTRSQVARFALVSSTVALACSSSPSDDQGQATGGAANGSGSALVGSGGDLVSSGGNASGGVNTGGSLSSSGGAATGSGASPASGGATAKDCASRTDLIVCEDFETTKVGEVPDGWTAQGTIAVTDTIARGTRSLKVGATNNGPRRISQSPAGLAGHWGRLYYRVLTPTPAVFAHSTLVELEGDGPNLGKAWYRVVDTVQNDQQKHQFLFNVQPASSGEFGRGSAYDWEFKNEWQCAEWHVDGASQSYHFYLNGAEITSIAIDNGAGNNGSDPNRTHLPMTFSSVSVGWYNYQSAPPGFEAWLDDLAIGTTRIGCD